MFSFYFALTGRAAAWVVGIVFTIVGLVIFLLLPPIVAPSRDREAAILLVRILGAAFFLMGIGLLLWMSGDLYLAAKHPELRERYFWWGNFLAGMLGAALFAIPATLIFPFAVIFYLFRPNAIFPADTANDVGNLFVAFIFSIAGVLALAMMYFVGKLKYRERPQ